MTGTYCIAKYEWFASASGILVVGMWMEWKLAHDQHGSARANFDGFHPGMPWNKDWDERHFPLSFVLFLFFSQGKRENLPGPKEKRESDRPKIFAPNSLDIHTARTHARHETISRLSSAPQPPKHVNMSVITNHDKIIEKLSTQTPQQKTNHASVWQIWKKIQISLKFIRIDSFWKSTVCFLRHHFMTLY